MKVVYKSNLGDQEDVESIIECMTRIEDVVVEDTKSLLRQDATYYSVEKGDAVFTFQDGQRYDNCYLCYEIKGQ